MALTRNQRRKVARERQLAKAVRASKAAEIAQVAACNDIVRKNLSSPKPSRFDDGHGLYRSCIAGMKDSSFKGATANESNSTRLECRAGGAMPRQRALALKAKANKERNGHYARPAKSDDRSQWPVIDPKGLLAK